MKAILDTASTQFVTELYDGVIVCYSGHADTTHLILCDGRYELKLFESFFNGINIKERAKSYKFYFIDACRGTEDSELLENDDYKAVEGDKTR